MARTGNCDPASRGATFNEFELQIPLPNGSGFVNADVRYTWDGVSVWPACDGPVTFLRTRNTGTQTAWALLPDKKHAPLWVQIDPGTDVTVTSHGQLNTLGLANATDVESVRLSFVNPA